MVERVIKFVFNWAAFVPVFYMPKPAITLVFKLLRLRLGLIPYIPVAKVVCNGLPRCIDYYAQTCDKDGVQNGTEWSASEHASRMRKLVRRVVFKVRSAADWSESDACQVMSGASSFVMQSGGY